MEDDQWEDISDELLLMASLNSQPGEDAPIAAPPPGEDAPIAAPSPGEDAPITPPPQGEDAPITAPPLDNGKGPGIDRETKKSAVLGEGSSPQGEDAPITPPPQGEDAPITMHPPGEDAFLEVASMVVTWWIVALLCVFP